MSTSAVLVLAVTFTLLAASVTILLWAGRHPLTSRLHIVRIRKDDEYE